MLDGFALRADPYRSRQIELTMTTPPGSAATHVPDRGLHYWMRRVLDEIGRARIAEDPEAVHDLRVALRHCRSIAAVLSEVDRHPAWQDFRKTGRKLFRRLGSLRNAQVMAGWAAKLGGATGVISAPLNALLAEREQAAREEALLALSRFDGNHWKQLARGVRERSRLIRPNSLTARCIALERYEEARALHAQALRSRTITAWHVLRVGIKHFRYAVETFLPERYADWEDDLKRLQDILGEVHDLDELNVLLTSKDERLAAEQSSLARLRDVIAGERALRLRTYRQVAGGKRGLWYQWRAGLPEERQIPGIILARFRATAAALDPQPQKAREISQIARALLRTLAAARLNPVVCERNSALVLQSAAGLINIGRSRSRKDGHKAAQRMILGLELPPGWSPEQLTELACIVRYHRGAEPKQSHRTFAELSAEGRNRVLVLSGVLRFAYALWRSGMSPDAPIRLASSFDGVELFIPGLPDTQTIAARIAAGKHLLETALRRIITVRPAQTGDSVRAQAATPR